MVHVHTSYIALPVTGQIQIIGTLCICNILLGYLDLRKQVFQATPGLADVQFNVDFVFMEFQPVDLLGYFLRLDTGLLLSPVEDRDTEADGNTRILRRVIINLFQMSVITDQTEGESNISLELVQSLRLNHIES